MHTVFKYAYRHQIIHSLVLTLPSQVVVHSFGDSTRLEVRFCTISCLLKPRLRRHDASCSRYDMPMSRDNVYLLFVWSFRSLLTIDKEQLDHTYRERHRNAGVDTPNRSFILDFQTYVIPPQWHNRLYPKAYLQYHKSNLRASRIDKMIEIGMSNNEESPTTVCKKHHQRQPQVSRERSCPFQR